MSKLYLIGGPNGIGKSSQAARISHEKTVSFINPDLIIAESRIINSEIDDISLRHIIRLTVDDKLDNNESFIFESNLHNYQSYEIVNRVRQFGYEVELIFMCTDYPDMLDERVQKRVFLQGHNVPQEEIIRRYLAGINLLCLIKSL